MKSDKLTRGDVGLIEGFTRNENWIYWVFIPPLIVFNIIATVNFFDSGKLAQEAGIPSMWVTAFGTEYENKEMYSGTLLKINKYLVYFIYSSFLLVLDIVIYSITYRFHKAVRIMWKIVESKEAAYRKKLAKTGAAKSESSESEESQVQ